MCRRVINIPELKADMSALAREMERVSEFWDRDENDNFKKIVLFWMLPAVEPYLSLYDKCICMQMNVFILYIYLCVSLLACLNMSCSVVFLFTSCFDFSCCDCLNLKAGMIDEIMEDTFEMMEVRKHCACASPPPSSE